MVRSARKFSMNVGSLPLNPSLWISFNLKMCLAGEEASYFKQCIITREQLKQLKHTVMQQSK